MSGLGPEADCLFSGINLPKLTFSRVRRVDAFGPLPSLMVSPQRSFQEAAFVLALSILRAIQFANARHNHFDARAKIEQEILTAEDAGSHHVGESQSIRALLNHI